MNLKEGSFSVTGSEEFVGQQTKDFFELVKQMNLSFNNKQVEVEQVQRALSLPLAQSEVQPSVTGNDKYIKGGIFSIDASTGEVRILKRVPGGSKAAKMKNVAMIVLYAKGNNPISNDEVKVLCEKQACLDKPNFAKAFSSDMDGFIKKGKPQSQSWTLELSLPGQETAEKLLEEMLNATK